MYTCWCNWTNVYTCVNKQTHMHVYICICHINIGARTITSTESNMGFPLHRKGSWSNLEEAGNCPNSSVWHSLPTRWDGHSPILLSAYNSLTICSHSWPQNHHSTYELASTIIKHIIFHYCGLLLVAIPFCSPVLSILAITSQYRLISLLFAMIHSASIILKNFNHHEPSRTNDYPVVD